MIINYNNLTTREYLRRYFDILNTAQPVKSKRLAKSEIDVLIEFMLLPKKFENKRFGSLAKVKVLESLKEMNYVITRANLNNKIYSLLDKGYLRKDIDSVIYPQTYVKKGVDLILSSLEEGKDYDIIFRFKDDSKRSQGAIQTNSSSNGSTTL